MFTCIDTSHVVKNMKFMAVFFLHDLDLQMRRPMQASIQRLLLNSKTPTQITFPTNRKVWTGAAYC